MGGSEWILEPQIFRRRSVAVRTKTALGSGETCRESVPPRPARGRRVRRTLPGPVIGTESSRHCRSIPSGARPARAGPGVPRHSVPGRRCTDLGAAEHPGRAVPEVSMSGHDSALTDGVEGLVDLAHSATPEPRAHAVRTELLRHQRPTPRFPRTAESMEARSGGPEQPSRNDSVARQHCATAGAPSSEDQAPTGRGGVTGAPHPRHDGVPGRSSAWQVPQRCDGSLIGVVPPSGTWATCGRP
jgi:hypothetical protein